MALTTATTTAAALDVRDLLVRLFANDKIVSADSDDATFDAISAQLAPSARADLHNYLPYDRSHDGVDMTTIFGAFLMNMEQIPLNDTLVTR